MGTSLIFPKEGQQLSFKSCETPHLARISWMLHFIISSKIRTIFKIRCLFLKKGRRYYVCVFSVLLGSSKYSSQSSSFLHRWCIKGKRIVIKGKGEGNQWLKTLWRCFLLFRVRFRIGAWTVFQYIAVMASRTKGFLVETRWNYFTAFSQLKTRWRNGGYHTF